MFVINCKNYREVAGRKIVKLVAAAEEVTERYGVKIAIAPPQHQIGLIGKSPISILAQHVDDAGVGSTTGYAVPELLKKSGVKGSLINHSEHRIPASQIRSIVAKMAELNMITIVCVKDVAEARRYARWEPDYIAIEPPELIGSGKAVSKERPELVSQAASAVRSSRNKTRLLCGAGIVSGQDVSRAIELGAGGILVASGIVKARGWKRIIDEFAKSMI